MRNKSFFLFSFASIFMFAFFLSGCSKHDDLSDDVNAVESNKEQRTEKGEDSTNVSTPLDSILMKRVISDKEGTLSYYPNFGLCISHGPDDGMVHFDGGCVYYIESPFDTINLTSEYRTVIFSGDAYPSEPRSNTDITVHWSGFEYYNIYLTSLKYK